MLELPEQDPGAPTPNARLRTSPEHVAWRSRAANPFKEAMRRHLFTLQGGRCAYCENHSPPRTDDATLPAPGTSRLDHVQPQSKYPHVRYTPSNLVLSCQSPQGKRPEAHCDTAKADDTLPIRPSPGCNAGITMTTHGELAAKHDSTQRTRDLTRTFDVLNLNAPRLVMLRRQAAHNLIALLNDTSISTTKRAQAVEAFLNAVDGSNYVRTLLS